MSTATHATDLHFFSTLTSKASLSAAAREMGISTAAVSKHLAQMESRLGVTLVTRSTRRMGLTPEGETYLGHARRILADMDDLDQLIGTARVAPKGLLRVNATLGFGRRHVAPVISRFAWTHPDVEVQLQLSVNPPPLTDDAFDVCIRFGEPPDTRVIAHRIATNQRMLCASPTYLAQHGTPKTPHDLAHHNCIGIRQGDEAYGLWRITPGRGSKLPSEAIKARGNLSTNDGEIAVNWALDGHGIVLRARWDIAHHLESGRLVQVLPHCHTPEADIYAVVPKRHHMSVRVRSFVDFICTSFNARYAENLMSRQNA